MSTSLAPLAHTVRSRALSWLHTHRELSVPDAGDLAPDLDAVKTLAEMALAAGLALTEGTAGSRERRLARELLDFCWLRLGQGALLYERLLHHPMTTDAVECYAPFAQAGYRHAGLEDLTSHLAVAGIAHIVEYVPCRRLAVANALRITGHDSGTRVPDWERLVQATWLAATPQPWHIDWETAYALTHTVFHITDWGRRPEALPRPLTAYLTRWLPVWTDIWTETRHWDLVAELLAVGACLPEPHIDLDDWQRMERTQHPDGLFPVDGRPLEEDPATRFRDHYHSTTVSAIAATIALSRDLTLPSAAVPDPSA
ncbi:DUF6895 family protein [Streptomyces sp. WELS2]|uniref:DUF6895 family protein n=1 Tax=Streptomyces sp. WELS2 TaxID=2749435 RepID=UPI0015F0C1DE|nr:hypothetical protein [Streptomyces sp. WELS2]